MVTDNARLWSAPVEVSVTEMRCGYVMDRPKYDLYRDVVRRLEQTKLPFAVRYTFADRDTARAYGGYVQRRALGERGNGTVSMRVRLSDGGEWHVYFARGPQYDGAVNGSSNRK